MLPLKDLKRHDLSRNCWCNPQQDDENPTVWIHNSADGREEYEAGRKMH
jgi:hypothetical protein